MAKPTAARASVPTIRLIIMVSLTPSMVFRAISPIAGRDMAMMLRMRAFLFCVKRPDIPDLLQGLRSFVSQWSELDNRVNSKLFVFFICG